MLSVSDLDKDLQERTVPLVIWTKTRETLIDGKHLPPRAQRYRYLTVRSLMYLWNAHITVSSVIRERDEHVHGGQFVNCHMPCIIVLAELREYAPVKILQHFIPVLFRVYLPCQKFLQ